MSDKYGAAMQKIILIILLAAETGCGYIFVYQTDPKSLSPMLEVTCNGTSVDWNYCYEAASKLCSSGYAISDKREKPDTELIANRTSIIRSIYFRCN
jgi:hypothetical protein